MIRDFTPKELRTHFTLLSMASRSAAAEQDKTHADASPKKDPKVKPYVA